MVETRSGSMRSTTSAVAKPIALDKLPMSYS
jgi:hypothetical protein